MNKIQTNFWTLLKAEIKFSFTWKNLGMSLFVATFSMVVIIGALWSPWAYVIIAPTAFVYAIQMRLQLKIASEIDSNERMRAAYLHYSTAEVFFAKLITDFIIFMMNIIIIMLVLSTIGVMIGAGPAGLIFDPEADPEVEPEVGVVPGTEYNFFVVMWKLFPTGIGFFVLYEFVWLTAQLAMSFANSSNAKKIAGVAVVSIITLPYLAMSYIVGYWDVLQDFFMDKDHWWIWFIPVVNTFALAVPLMPNMYLVIIPMIYVVGVIGATYKWTSKKIKRGNSL